MCIGAAAVPVITVQSWRCRGLYLCCLTQDKGCNCSNIHILHPIHHMQKESHTSRPPVCPSLRRANNRAGLQLRLHLPTPHMNTYRGAHACAYTHRDTHRQASLRLPADLKWRMSGSHFLSKQSKPGNTSIICM